jgi:pimeloyl-ACP methyl ester carboxylesterase
METDDGAGLWWRHWGEAAPELLMIHCTLAHSGAWSGLAAALGRPALAPDLPGHGKSGDWDRSQDLQQQSLDAVLDGIAGQTPLHVIGHSFGATVALRLALEHPDLVRRLVLIEPVFFAAARGTPDYEENARDFAPFDAAMRSGDAKEAARVFTERWGAGVAWDQMRAAQRLALTEQIHLVPAQNGSIFEDNAGQLRPGRLEGLDLPVMLVEGSRSPGIIGAIAAALAARLPQATRQVIDGAGHMVPISHAKAVATVVRPFLDR